jgi:hypothetical protein
MKNCTLIWMVVGLVILTDLALGGYDPSGQIAAENLSLNNSSAMESDVDSAALADLALQMAATGPGDEQAVYTDEAPSQTSIGQLMPFDIQDSPLGKIYYGGNYLAWRSFGSIFPQDSPGLWISGSNGWSWYVAMPLGSWTQELLYVPFSSYLSMYETYPGGYTRRYNLGYVQPGYYLIWYYADAPGRHFSQFALGNSRSNTLAIDVYSLPGPIRPTQREQCEQNPQCSWVNGNCYCSPKPAPNPVAECEARGCQWYDGDCHCDTPGPAPNPVAECEKNPNCHYADGQCLCTGAGSSSGATGGSTDSI